MVAKKALPADDLKGLVAWMKANPGKATFVNQNAAAQVTGILFQQATGTQVQFIPYRGAGPAMQDLVAGQVDLLVVQAAAALPQVRAGTIKALANLSPRRSPAMPDLPTSDEGGVPGLYASGWFGFFAPAGTPKEVIARLNGAMVEALADPAVRDRFVRARARRRRPRAADAGGPRRLPQGRDREMVADHQGRRASRRSDRCAMSIAEEMYSLAEGLLGRARRARSTQPTKLYETRKESAVGWVEPSWAKTQHDLARPARRQGSCDSSSRSLKRWILPVAVRGRSGRTSIQRGYFHAPARSLTCTFSVSSRPSSAV